jgi:hypothetical protein
MTRQPDPQDVTKTGKREHKKKLELRGKIVCGLCKPNRGENTKRKPKPDKYKTKRKGK